VAVLLHSFTLSILFTVYLTVYTGKIIIMAERNAEEVEIPPLPARFANLNVATALRLLRAAYSTSSWQEYGNDFFINNSDVYPPDTLPII